MERVWIGIGSNLEDPKKQVDQAIWSLSKLPLTKLLALSSYYRSCPLGFQDQPYFLNMVVVLKTNLYPEELLDYMQYIEHQQGRIRNSFLKKWMPRTLDLDILLFDKYVINTSKLIIPHYDIKNREFVIYPLIELEYDFILPDAVKIMNIVKTIPKRGLTFWHK